MIKILFQGDSITDCERNKENELCLGKGYCGKIAGKYGFEFPGEYEFINKGINGNRITDLYARIKSDIINLKPDVLSILIGVNDVLFETYTNNGVSEKKFEKVYDMLISEILEELPNIKIIIMEPFVLRERGSRIEEDWENTSLEVKKRANAARRIAEKFNLKFVPLQNEFNEALKKQPEIYWTFDGVHPRTWGHELIARQWIKAFEEIK